jgi:hypothetical protein
MINDDINTIVENEIEKEYARLVAVLAAMEDNGVTEADQLAYFKGLLGAQYAYLNGLLSEEVHTKLMNQLYDVAGLHGDHKFAHLFV